MVEQKASFRWIVLLLTFLVNLCANGLSFSCMPSLYGEIIQDIPMTYSQWGTVWGICFLPMMIFTLIGGVYADRAGTRSIVGLATILIGILGIGRAFAQDYNQLLCLMFLLGIGSSFLMPNLPKSLGHWFTSRELGLANGVLIAGICLGSGSALMASGVYLSPLVGGWRNVMWCYGLLSIILGVVWLWIFRECKRFPHDIYLPSEKFTFREALSVVMHVRDLWLLMASRFCIIGALIAVIGFLPEILVAKGMTQRLSHLSSSLIYYVNIIGVIAIPLISDKFGRRKIFIWPFSLLAAFLLISLGVLTGIGCLIICALLGLINGLKPLPLVVVP